MKADNKRRVCCLWWPERHGTVVREGDEVSEIRWDKTNISGDISPSASFEPNHMLRDLDKRWRKRPYSHRSKREKT